jgi:small GTP-binding protein
VNPRSFPIDSTRITDRIAKPFTQPTPSQNSGQPITPGQMTDEVPHYKIVLLGNTGVGKTALVDRVSKDVFSQSHVPTVGAQFVSLEMCVDGHACILELWDTAGQEVFRSLVGFYTRDAKGCFILFDLTKEPSYAALPQWFDFIHENAPDASIVLFGNKKDLVNDRAIYPGSASTFATSKECSYFEGSAKTAEGVSDAFDKMAELVCTAKNARDGNVVALDTQKIREKKNCC